jgi:hypothetical protein
MPGNDDHDELSDEDLAALEDYENSAEGRMVPAPNPAEVLTRLFNKTPEMQECITTANSIAEGLDPEDPVAVQVYVPRQFMRLTEFLEQKRAVAAGVEARMSQEVLNQILLNELHDQLHALITGPARFGYYRELWNRFCDANGAPELKIVEPRDDGKGTAIDGPF